MKALRDPQKLLTEGLAAIRAQFRIPGGFPPEVIAAAEQAAQRAPSAHEDWTARQFVTLDPAGATDLDQAFAIEPAGQDWLLHYAIADVAWFVDEGGAIDAEAWKRGTTTYLPGGKASLYPRVLSEGAASLLPANGPSGGPRPAVAFTVRVDSAGAGRLDQVRRVIIRSRAKLAYETATEADLPPGFAALTGRIMAAEDQRGAARVDPPEQELAADSQGRYRLQFRPLTLVEQQNAALSLAANMAVAQSLYQAGTGLFRVMAPPSAEAEARLRLTAQAFELNWPEALPLADFERGLDGHDPRQAAFMLAVRRAGAGASYAPYTPGERPWHSAVAATYAHATAPLRRLADRYVIRAALAVANGQPVPADVTDAFARLPAVMARADARDGQVERAAIDLAEAAILSGREGESFAAMITDQAENGARIQLCDEPVVARLPAPGLLPGTRLSVRLASADTTRRTVQFEVQA